MGMTSRKHDKVSAPQANWTLDAMYLEPARAGQDDVEGGERPLEGGSVGWMGRSTGISQMTQRGEIFGSRINKKSSGSGQPVVTVDRASNTKYLQQLAEDIVSREVAHQLHGSPPPGATAKNPGV